MKLDPGIIPREIHKLLGFENSSHFVNEKDPGDVNIDLDQNIVCDSLVKWRGLLVLQMNYIEKPEYKPESQIQNRRVKFLGPSL